MDHIDHAYACEPSKPSPPSNNVLERMDSTSSTESECEMNSESTHTPSSLSEQLMTKATDLDASKKVLVESLQAADLGAVHEKLIKSSPNKSWYLNEKRTDKSSNGTSSTTSEVDQAGPEDETEAAMNTDRNPSHTGDYAPMSPLDTTERGTGEEKDSTLGANLLKERDDNELEDSHLNGGLNSEHGDEATVNGLMKDTESEAHAKYLEKNPNNDSQEDTDQPKANLDDSSSQIATQTSEADISLDSSAEAGLNDSIEQASGTENGLLSPRTKMRRRPGKKRRRFSKGPSTVRWSPRKPSVESTPVRDNESNLDDPLSTLTLDGDERPRRRSRTPIRQNPEEYLVGDEDFPMERKPTVVPVRMKQDPNLTPEQIEQFSKPLRCGWRRELVLRGVWDDFKQKNPPVDVYYHPPKGTGPKLRSMVGIIAWLNANPSDLTSDNFTFMRRPCGAEEGEVTRQASVQRGRASAAAAARKRVGDFEFDSPKTRVKKPKPEIVIERDTDDMISPLLAAVVKDVHNDKLIQENTPVVNGEASHGELNEKGEKVETMFPSSETVIISPPKKKFKPTARKSTTQKAFKKPKPRNTIRVSNSLDPDQDRHNVSPDLGSKLFEKVFSRRQKSQLASIPSIEALCTLTCPGLEGIAPLLRCNVCMCLFHPQCVNYKGEIQRGFICLRCVDLCNTAPQDRSVVMEDGIMRVPDPTQFDTVNKTSSPIPIKMTQVIITSSGLPNFSNLLSSLSTTATSPQTVTTMNGLVNQPTVASSPVTVRVTTPAALKDWSTTKIKQEPMEHEALENSDAVRKEQASVEALGSLKNVINTRLGQNSVFSSPVLASQLGMRSISPQQPYFNIASSSPSLFNVNTINPGQPLMPKSLPSRTLTSPLYTGVAGNKVFPNNAATAGKSNMPSIIHLPVMNSVANNSILQTNSGLKLVPIGPPVKINQPGHPASFSPFPVTPIPRPQTLLTAVVTSTKSTVTTSSISSQSNSITVSAASSKLVSTSAEVGKEPAKAKTVQTVINTSAVCAPKNGQLLTLPPAVVKKITPNKPLQLKINNVQLNVPPSGFFMTSDGLKVFVPPNTFPTADVDFCFSVSDDKTIVTSSNSSGKTPNSNKSAESDKNSQKEKAKESPEASKKTEQDKPAEKPDIRMSTRYGKCCHIHKLYGGYDCIQQIFKLLNVRDLISVGSVCRTWRMISKHPFLWKDVRFKDVKVSSWQNAMCFLAKRKVEGVNFLGLLHYDEPNRTWHQLISSLQDLPSIRRIAFGIVPATVLHSVCERLSHLEGFTAESISDFNNETMWNRPTKLDIGKFACLTSLKELRLKGLSGLSAPSFSFSGGLPELVLLKNLEKLSILSLRSVPETQFHFLSQLTQLQELALGDCNTWTSETFFQLGKLCNLRSLSLEHGGEIPDVGLGEALLNMTKLEKLELNTYTIADTLGGYLKQLPGLKALILRPDNCFLPAEVNTNTLTAVSELTFLEKLDWAISSSDNSSIILDNNDNTEPVSRTDGQQWIPLHAEKSSEEESEEAAAENKKTAKLRLEYIQLHKLAEKVAKSLPTTKTKVYCLNPVDAL